jgi:4-hydroxy-tetrahydrodipicolinate synthase
MAKNKKYSGIVIPTVTPLTADMKLDHAAVRNMIHFFHEHGAHPFVLGTTGEAASVPVVMKKEFLQLAGKLKSKDSLLYAGISTNALDESIELAKYSFDQGADVVVTTLPSYYSLSESFMLKYFEQLAENIPGPMMIYNIPATTHMSIPLQVIERLSHHENIVGTKDSERNEERLKESIRLWKARNDFSHLLGWAAKSANAILLGSDGLVPSTGNFQPKLYVDLYNSARGGEEEKALALQELSDVLGNLYQQGRTLGESLWALKVLMKESGLCEPYVLPPLYEQGEVEVKKLQAGLQQVLKAEVKTLG